MNTTRIKVTLDEDVADIVKAFAGAYRMPLARVVAVCVQSALPALADMVELAKEHDRKLARLTASLPEVCAEELPEALGLNDEDPEPETPPEERELSATLPQPEPEPVPPDYDAWLEEQRIRDELWLEEQQIREELEYDALH